MSRSLAIAGAARGRRHRVSRPRAAHDDRTREAHEPVSDRRGAPRPSMIGDRARDVGRDLGWWSCRRGSARRSSPRRSSHRPRSRCCPRAASPARWSVGCCRCCSTAARRSGSSSALLGRTSMLDRTPRLVAGAIMTVACAGRSAARRAADRARARRIGRPIDELAAGDPAPRRLRPAARRRACCWLGVAALAGGAALVLTLRRDAVASTTRALPNSLFPSTDDG